MDQRWQSDMKKAPAKIPQVISKVTPWEIGPNGKRRITDAKARELANACWNRGTGQGVGCGGISLESETDDSWLFRIMLGYGGSPAGQIAVDKHTDSTREL